MADDDPAPAADEPEAEASWTFLVYMMGDTNLEPYALDDLTEMASVGSSERRKPSSRMRVITERSTGAGPTQMADFRAFCRGRARLDFAKRFAERRRRFLQEDHVRLYGDDLEGRVHMDGDGSEETHRGSRVRTYVRCMCDPGHTDDHQFACRGRYFLQTS